MSDEELQVPSVRPRMQMALPESAAYARMQQNDGPRETRAPRAPRAPRPPRPPLATVGSADVLRVLESVLGQRVLVLLPEHAESGVSDVLAWDLERLGAVAHTWAPSAADYARQLQAAPHRPCWVQDFASPWLLNLPDRYDLVVALGVLETLTDPRPLLGYLTQLAPRMLVDVRTDRTDAEWFVSELAALDVDAEEVACGSKLDGQRRRFIARRRRDRLSPLLVHVHIPKTAGQSFNQYLSDNVQGRIVHLYGPGPMTAQWDMFKEVVSAPPASSLVFASHSMRMTFPRILGGRLALYLSLFREPYATVLSYIKYVRKEYDNLVPAHKTVLSPDTKTMSVPDLMRWHCKNVHFLNFLGLFLPVFFLTGQRDLERARQIVRTSLFWIGLTEQMARSLELLRRKTAPYGFQFGTASISRTNTTDDVSLDGYDITQDAVLRDYGGGWMATEVEFYAWVRDYFEQEAQRWGV